jgi:hypothetical protein
MFEIQARFPTLRRFVMMVMIFLVGMFLGALAGAMLCIRYLDRRSLLT